MTTLGVLPVQVRAESTTPLIRGEIGWAVLLGTLLVWALIAFAAYFVIRLAVRHALQDVARESSPSDTERRAARVDAE